MMHVSREIFWISPIVDALFFFSLAMICVLLIRFVPRAREIFWISPIVDALFFFSLAMICVILIRFVPRAPVVRVLVFLLTFLSVYDWLTLTNRLYHRACLLLAFGAGV